MIVTKAYTNRYLKAWQNRYNRYFVDLYQTYADVYSFSKHIISIVGLNCKSADWAQGLTCLPLHPPAGNKSLRPSQQLLVLNNDPNTLRWNLKVELSFPKMLQISYRKQNRDRQGKLFLWATFWPQQLCRSSCSFDKGHRQWVVTIPQTHRPPATPLSARNAWKRQSCEVQRLSP